MYVIVAMIPHEDCGEGYCSLGKTILCETVDDVAEKMFSLREELLKNGYRLTLDNFEGEADEWYFDCRNIHGHSYNVEVGVCE